MHYITIDYTTLYYVIVRRRIMHFLKRGKDTYPTDLRGNHSSDSKSLL